VRHRLCLYASGHELRDPGFAPKPHLRLFVEAYPPGGINPQCFAALTQASLVFSVKYRMVNIGPELF
jgi:hypothetical protein